MDQASSNPSRPNLTSWLQAARSGDAVAWGCLLEYFRPYLRFLAESQLGRKLTVKAEALDLVQETFLQAHRKFHKFLGTTGEEFAAWLEAILASRIEKLVRQYYSTARRDIRLEVAAGFADSTRLLDEIPLDPQPSPGRAMVSREQAVRVALAIEQLTPEQQEVILARHLEGMSFPDIATRLGKSTDAVTHLWVRAIRRLKQWTEGDPP
jgi:RNA polymerase sigma-70 factor, ECF subfamily